MAMTRPRKLFLNLAVRDLDRSKEFFTKLGFEFNPQFTDEALAAIVAASNAGGLSPRRPTSRVN